MRYDVISPSSLGSLYSNNFVAIETGSYTPPVSDLGGDISSFIEFFALDVSDIFSFIISDIILNPAFFLVMGFVLVCVGVNIVKKSSHF